MQLCSTHLTSSFSQTLPVIIEECKNTAVKLFANMLLYQSSKEIRRPAYCSDPLVMIMSVRTYVATLCIHTHGNSYIRTCSLITGSGWTATHYSTDNTRHSNKCCTCSLICSGNHRNCGCCHLHKITSQVEQYFIQ